MEQRKVGIWGSSKALRLDAELSQIKCEKNDIVVVKLENDKIIIEKEKE